jgi:hypothetical protein
MSGNINSNANKVSPISTGSLGLESAVIAGMKLLGIARLGSPLGIAACMLPLALMKNFRLIRVLLEAADRVMNGSRSKRQEGVRNEDSHTGI